jgi:hypothetical protein
MWTRSLSVAALAFFAALPVQPLGAQIEYSVERITPVPGAFSTSGTGMNELGHVVGWSQHFDGGPNLRAWVWTPTTGLTYLPTPPTQSNARAIGINDAGVIAGDGGFDSGLAWRYDGGYEMIPVFDGDSVGTAGGINASGQIAGTSRNGQSFLIPPHAFLETPGLGIQGVQSGGWGGRINDAGQIVGYASNAAWVFTPGSGSQFIGPLGSKPLTWAWGLNNAGSVVGDAAQANGNGHVPWVWTAADGMTEIGNFGGSAIAVDINAQGSVLGNYSPGPTQPFTWSAANGIRFFANHIDPAEQLALMGATIINDAGQILCSAMDLTNAQRFPVVLTPLGDPTPWTSLGGGVVGQKGLPDLGINGSLASGTPVDISLIRAPFSGLALLWVSVSSTPFNVLGGTVHAYPVALKQLFQTSVLGQLNVSVAWPAGVPAGTKIWFQFICQDGSVPAGLTLSDAVMGVTP